MVIGATLRPAVRQNPGTCMHKRIPTQIIPRYPGSIKSRAHPAFMLLLSGLKYNADQPAASLIDDPLQRFLKLVLRVVGHAVELVVQAFIDEFMERLAKYIGIPNFLGVGVKLL